MLIHWRCQQCLVYVSHSNRTPPTCESGTDAPVFSPVSPAEDLPVRDTESVDDGAHHRKLDEHELRLMLVEFMTKHKHKAGLCTLL